jgi:hypothetical protein
MEIVHDEWTTQLDCTENKIESKAISDKCQKKKKNSIIIATRQDIVLSLTHEMLKHPFFVFFFGLVTTHDDVYYDIPF